MKTPGFRSMFYDIEGKGSLTLEESVTRAKEVGREGQIVAQKSKYIGKVDAMHDAQPTMDLLVYVNGTHSTRLDLPDAWYLKDASGDRVRAADPWESNLLMNPLEPDWVAYRVANCLDLLADSKYDALYVDEVGTGCVTAVSTGKPIDPRTGREWTTVDWTKDMSTYLATIQTSVGKPTWFNGLREANGFYGLPPNPAKPDVKLPPQKVLLDGGAAGGASEQWLRNPGQEINTYQRDPYWENTVKMLDDCGDRIMTLTKTWVTPATQDQKDKWHRYALSTFMAGTLGAHFYFTYIRATNVTAKHPYWSIARALGSAIGPRYPQGSIFQRDFSGGRILVNPTITPVTVVLGVSLKTMTGERVTSIEIPAHDGALLRT